MWFLWQGSPAPAPADRRQLSPAVNFAQGRMTFWRTRGNYLLSYDSYISQCSPIKSGSCSLCEPAVVLPSSRRPAAQLNYRQCSEHQARPAAAQASIMATCIWSYGMCYSSCSHLLLESAATPQLKASACPHATSKAAGTGESHAADQASKPACPHGVMYSVELGPSTRAC